MPQSEKPSSRFDRRKLLKSAATTAGVMFIKPGWFAGRRQTPLCGLGCWDAQGAALRTQPT
jgi:hypothetical protein